MRRALLAVPTVPVAMAGIVATQVLRAAHRSDLPSFPNQDPSGIFGDASSPPLRMVAVGDSSITSPGVERLDETWVRRVSLALSDRFRVELISLAVGGSKAKDLVEGQLEEAVRLQPDIAIVSVGSNDAIRGVPPRRFRVEMDHLVSRLEEAAGGVVVLGMGDLGSIPRLPPLLRPYLSARSRRFNRICTDVAVSHPRTVKVWTGGRVSSAFWEDRSLFADDLFHAGSGGHAVFAEAITPAVEAALVIARRPEAAAG